MQDLKLSYTWQNFQSRSYYSSRITELGIFRNVSSFARSPLIFSLMVEFKYFLGGSLKRVCKNTFLHTLKKNWHKALFSPCTFLFTSYFCVTYPKAHSYVLGNNLKIKIRATFSWSERIEVFVINFTSCSYFK